MAKKIPCRVIKSDPFVELRKTQPNAENNQFRRAEDVIHPQVFTDANLGWLGLDRADFDRCLTGIVFDYYA